MTIIDRFKQITTFVLDVDGVLTEGTIYVFDNGEQVRGMSTRDGFALQLAIKKGYRIFVISGGNSPAVVERLRRLGVLDVFMNVHDKRTVLLQLMKENDILKEHVLYMGDDIPDYTPMQEVGLPCAPADAATEIKGTARYISAFDGGRGCVREVIERVLKLNGHWELDTNIASK
jgi:3-deoxy-D-manno-octulosonate 8-phosphate phosphatase (KDO 8-P phosphatase)